MGSYLDKFQINTAITDNTKLDLSRQHITTGDFMELNCSMIQEMVPGSKIDVNMASFARLNPLPVPTFGRCQLRSRAFMVPWRTIFRGVNDFLTDAPHVGSAGYSAGATGSLISSVPRVSTEDLRDAFVNYIGTVSTDGSSMLYGPITPNATNSNWDVTITSGGVTSYYCYTVKGRQCLKLLEQLGYKIDWNHGSKTTYLSALPLLALCKIYVDWYYPMQYSNRTEYDLMLSLCNYDVQGSILTLTAAQVNSILSLCSYVQYDSDLFVSAWDQPNQPNDGNYSDFKLVNIDTASSYYTNSAYSYQGDGYVTNNTSAASVTNRIGRATAPFITPYVDGSNPNGTVGPANTPISEYLLHSLHALTDYMKRHQLAGSKSFERYLARFGKALPAEKLNRSLYLGSSVQDVQIGDVMSTADTVSAALGTGSQLGTYAGKGLSYGEGHFSCSTDEFGYFIVLTSIVPATGYFQGIDPMVMRTSKLDMFTPEFDSLGVEGLPAACLYMPPVAGQMGSGDPYSQVFGFVPRYASYKCSTCSDRLTGNFRIPSLNSGNFNLNTSGAWHLMREFKSGADFNNDYANVVHSPQFISGGADFSQYKRLFYDILPDAPDNFTIIHNFDVAMYAPMKSLYDEYEFEDKGKKVTLEANGVKLN